jgi:hypothetical protein
MVSLEQHLMEWRAVRRSASALEFCVNDRDISVLQRIGRELLTSMKCNTVWNFFRLKIVCVLAG